MSKPTPPTIHPESTWLVSDTHFGHENIIGFCNRPEDHEQVMMEEWARAVGENDTVLHLGDLSYRNNGMFKHVISKHLTGKRKLLVRGNHDRQNYSFYRQAGFKLTRDFEIVYRDWRISFSHYPWNTERDGTMPANMIRIHGHIHNNGYTRAAFVPFRKNHINLSVEQTHYRPVNLKLLLDGALYGEYPETEPPSELAVDDKGVASVQTQKPR